MNKYLKQLTTLAIMLMLSLTGQAQWTQIGTDIDGEAAGDISGYSVSLSADGAVVAIGASNNSSYAGHVRIFENIAGTWTQIGTDIDGEAAGDVSGLSVSLNFDGSVVAIGAPHNDSYAGHVRIFENIAGTWTQIGTDIDGEATGDELGYSVSLSGDGAVVAIGARRNGGNGVDAGHVRVYENIAGTWTQIGTDIDGEAASDFSGNSVCLSTDGSVVAIGAYKNDGNGSDAGHVRVYENIAGTWTQIGTDIDGEEAGDWSGYSVRLSADGSIVAIGAILNNGSGSSAGHVRVYENIAGAWTQIGTDIDGEAEGDNSGLRVSLSTDGAVVGIGAPYNSGSGTESGHVRIYKNISGTWIQIGSDIDGEAAEDNSGWSVSLSADGSEVAIGAYYNDGNGVDAGHVRIYTNPTIGLDELNNRIAISIYPNPTSDVLFIKGINTIPELERIEIHSSIGQVVSTVKLIGQEMNVSDLPAGVYFLNVYHQHGVEIIRFVKQ
ncbi:MAG: T9SS type A sorting domain-containing protein [Crocinitomix sp.]|nr:T9SS type A sorting domain-containing protein [Crocinitomix sp.]